MCVGYTRKEIHMGVGDLIDDAREKMRLEEDRPQVIWCDDHGFVYEGPEGQCSACAEHYACWFPDDYGGSNG